MMINESELFHYDHLAQSYSDVYIYIGEGNSSLEVDLDRNDSSYFSHISINDSSNVHSLNFNFSNGQSIAIEQQISSPDLIEGDEYSNKFIYSNDLATTNNYNATLGDDYYKGRTDKIETINYNNSALDVVSGLFLTNDKSEVPLNFNYENLNEVLENKNDQLLIYKDLYSLTDQDYIDQYDAVWILLR